MAEYLVPGAILQDRYEVKRMLSGREGGAVYLAADRSSGGAERALKEISPAGLPPAELIERTARFQSCVETLLHFDHPHLARVYDYFSEGGRLYVVLELVEGVTLKTLGGMSVTPLPEEQVITWAIQVSEALHYLHDRPQPFVFGVLEGGNVMLNQEGAVKLINYGLDRFFALPDEESHFEKSKLGIGSDLRALAELIFSLVTREPAGEEAFSRLSSFLSAPLQAVLRKCFSLDPTKAFPSAVELSKELQKVLHPPEAPSPGAAVPGRKWKPDFKLSFEPVLDWFFLVFLQQKKTWLLAEAFLLLFLAGLWVYHQFPHYSYLKRGTVIYVICNERELWTLDFKTKKILDRRVMESKVRGILPDPKVGCLYLSGWDSGTVLVADLKTNEIKDRIFVDKDPTRMVLAQDGSQLYVLQEAASNVAVVSTRTRKLIGLIPVGNGPADLLLLPDGKTLCVANAGDSTVTLCDTVKNRPLATLIVPGGPSGLACSRDGLTLYISLRDWNNLCSVNLAKRELEYTYPDVGGQYPTALSLSPDGRSLYVMNARSGRMGLVSIESRKLTGVIPVGRSPAAMIQVPKGEKSFDLWVANRGSNTLSPIDTGTQKVTVTVNVGRSPTVLSVCR